MNKDLGSLADQLFNRAKNAVQTIGKTIQNFPEEKEKYKKFIEENFYTDGKYDSKKAEEFFSKKDTNIQKYGGQFYKLAELTFKVGGKVVTTVVNKVEDIIEKNIPSEQDMSEKYAGIGTKHLGLPLFKQDYEACLKFYNISSKILTHTSEQDSGTANEVLADIKASASVDYKELLKFYSHVSDKNVAEKKAVVDNYLSIDF